MYFEEVDSRNRLLEETWGNHTYMKPKIVYIFLLFILFIQPRQHIKKQRHYFVNKGLSSQSYGFSSSHVWMWELDYKESWALKNWCFWTVVLDKTLESPLYCKEIKPVNPKGNQLNIHWKNWCWSWNCNTLATWGEELTFWKDPDARKDWRQEEKGTIENEIIGWHHWLHGHEFEKAPGVRDRQGGLACCSPWGHKESDTTEQLNWRQFIFLRVYFWGVMLKYYMYDLMYFQILVPIH